MTFPLRSTASSLKLPARQQGVALMMVLFVFALVTILASGMISQQSLFIRKAANSLTQSQAYEYALGAESFARQILYSDWEDDKKDNLYVDTFDEIWGKGAAGFPIEFGVIEAQIDDLQGRFNINSLVNSNGAKDSASIERFRNLLIVLEIEEFEVEKIVDWIDENSESDGANGAEDGDYLGKETPYRSANQPFLSPSELMLIDGITPEIYAKLIPHVSTLPAGVKAVNVNTATLEVLRSFPKGKTLTESEGQAIIDKRDSEPFEKVEDFKAVPEYAGLSLEGRFAVASEFFSVSTRVTFAERVSRLVSVLHRDKKDGKLTLMERNQGLKYIITKQVVSTP